MRIFEDATLKDCGQISVILAGLCAIERVFRFEPQILTWGLRNGYNIFLEELLADGADNHITLLVIFHEASLEIFDLCIIQEFIRSRAVRIT